MNKFVVYAHDTKDTNKLFYVGEGTLLRAKSKSHRNRYWKFIVSKHEGFTYKIIRKGLTKREAENYETRLIRNLKKRNIETANFCIGPMYKNHWVLNISKEQHPMFGKKNPKASERMKKWNKEHCGEKSPVYGIKRPDLVILNKTLKRKRFSRKIKCIQTQETFTSIKEATAKFTSDLKNVSINKSLKNPKRKAFGFNWIYLEDRIT